MLRAGDTWTLAITDAVDGSLLGVASYTVLDDGSLELSDVASGLAASPVAGFSLSGAPDQVILTRIGDAGDFDLVLTLSAGDEPTWAALEEWGVTVLGHGGPGDRTDGTIRDLGLAVTVDTAIGGNDDVTGREGRDFVFGGDGDDRISDALDTGTDGADDVLVGDNARARPRPARRSRCTRGRARRRAKVTCRC